MERNREAPRRYRGRLDLREQWERNAPDWIRWARAPDHDTYWRFHRDQFLSILPPPGTRTVDIGCGEGRLSRDLAALGHQVVGIDISEAMVTAAHAADPMLPVAVGDAAALPLADDSVDLAVAFMSPQDVNDLAGAFQEAARVLRPGGRLCVAVVHPLNSAGVFEDREADSAFVIDGSYLDHRFYVDHVDRDGLSMAFASEHRPMETYVTALVDAGFLVEALREPAVPEYEGLPASGRRWQRIPLFLHLRAVRT